MDNYLDFMQNNTTKNCYHVPYECEYESMVDPVYDLCEELDLKDWDE